MPLGSHIRKIQLKSAWSRRAGWCQAGSTHQGALLSWSRRDSALENTLLSVALLTKQCLSEVRISVPGDPRSHMITQLWLTPLPQVSSSIIMSCCPGPGPSRDRWTVTHRDQICMKKRPMRAYGHKISCTWEWEGRNSKHLSKQAESGRFSRARISLPFTVLNH